MADPVLIVDILRDIGADPSDGQAVAAVNFLLDSGQWTEAQLRSLSPLEWSELQAQAAGQTVPAPAPTPPSPAAEASQQITSDISLAGFGGGQLAVDPIVQQIAAAGDNGTSVLQEMGYVELAPGDWALFDGGVLIDRVQLSTGAEGGLPEGFVAVGGKIFDIRSGEPVLIDSGGGGGGGAGPAARTAEQLQNEQLQNQLLQQQLGGTSPGFLEGQRQFDLGFGLEQDRFGFQTGPQFQEGQRQFNAGLGFDVASFGANLEQQRAIEQARLAESARGTNLQTALGGFQSINQLAPQLGQLALGNAQFTADTLRNPSDFLARAFFQRGGESPLPVVSQADIINQLRSNIGGFQGTLNQFQIPDQFLSSQPSFGFQIPQSDFNFTPPPSPAPAPATSTSFVTQSGTELANTGFTPRIENGELIAVPSLAHGGATTARRFVVGESPDGKPETGNEEVIENPTGAPIRVIPNPQNVPQTGFQLGTGPAPFDPNALTEQDIFEGNAGTSAATSLPVRGFEEPGPGGTAGVGDFSFPAPQLPSPDPVSQEELVRLARENSPPAVTSLFANEHPSPLQFGFNLFTPQQLGALTDAERQALNTRLAFEGPGGTTLADVETSIRQRFGRKRTQPRARQQAGFAF